MQIIDRTYEEYKMDYPIERICDPAGALFIDIETTGLSKETTSLYLIGCGYYTEKGFSTKLFFADSSSEEQRVLEEFILFSRSYTHLFHFNGTGFDIPYLGYKAALYDIPDPFSGMTNVDIYKMCKPLRYLLFPDSMKQKSIENFLGVGRQDRFNGGELIEVYKQYEKNPDDELLELLITHNREDVLGMHRILPILYYLDLKDAHLFYEGYNINRYKDYNGEEKEEVLFDYRTDATFPKSFMAKTESMYVHASAETQKISIRLPIYNTVLKIYFENYRDYCYIPDEDRALLKTIAQTLPKDRYRKATRDTCYQNVSAGFVKQPGDIFTPVFRSSLKDKKKYFRFPEDFNEKAAETFGRELLCVFFTMKKRPHLSSASFFS